jgi:glycerol dehydrogenase
MIDVFLAPKHYIQREGILREVGDYLRPFGQRPLVLGDELVLSIIRPILEDRLKAAGLAPSFVRFGEDCNLQEIARLEEIAREDRLDFIVGTGGGKAIDTARMVADRMKLPLITIPTSAATCSAASAAAVVYEKGVRQATIDGKGAELVLVDSGVISRAPARLLAAGMGDALTKWYEGKPCFDRMERPDPATHAAMTLSTQVKETIFSFGMEAKRDVDAGKNSDAVQTVIECNILLTGVISGLGGSRFRIAVPHALLYGLTIIPQIRQNLHGEITSYGIIVQLCLEKNEQELKAILPLFSQWSLPLTMKELGLSNVENSLFREGLKRTCAAGSAVHNLPFPVDERKLHQAMLEADERAGAFR